MKLNKKDFTNEFLACKCGFLSTVICFQKLPAITLKLNDKYKLKTA